MADSEQQNPNTQSNQTVSDSDVYGKLAIYILLSLALSALLLAGFHYLFHEASNLVPLLEFIARSVAALLNLAGESYNISPSSYMSLTVLEGDYNSALRVGKDSCGIVELLILLALILCWPSTFAKKFIACVSAIVVMFFLNTLRIACTLLIEIYFPAYSAIASDIALPLTYALCNAFYFMAWIKFSGGHPLHN